jgi:hypothetical protein
MVVVKDPVRVLVERRDVPCPVVRETPNGDPADPVLTFRVLVLPGDVIAGTGGQHLHLMPAGEPLRDQPAVILGATEYFRPIALDNERNLHEG